MTFRFALFTLLSLLLLSAAAPSQENLADSVKSEFLHAWNGYKKYAWGHDALKPLSKTPRDWYSSSLYMTPVDAFDTMVLMGLQNQAAEAKKLILDSLSFDKDMEVQSFEITIRLLGGLLSAYQLDGDPRFLRLAEDLGNRLLPVYDSPTGMPYRYVNLKTHKTRDARNNTAEIGTALLEFGALSKLTGRKEFYDKPKLALIQLFNRRSAIGLVGTWIDVESGKWLDKTSHIGGAIDSYYEYLIKSWRLFGDPDCKAMWDASIAAVNKYVADTAKGDLWYGQVDMETGKRTGTEFGSLEAFFPAVLCLGGDTDRAVALEESCVKMWSIAGIEPEEIDYSKMKIVEPQYVLRPEIIESAYYLLHFTKQEKYKKLGNLFFTDIRLNCRTEDAYAALRNVTTGEKSDQMESFFFAETLKYLYLIFGPPETLPFDEVTFGTEAHPLRKTWKD